MALRPLVSVRFQVLFHSPHRGSFHLSLTVLVHYRSSRVFSLGQWSALLPTRFLVSRGTQDLGGALGLSLTGLSPPLADLSSVLQLSRAVPLCRSYNPDAAVAPSVWAPPLSLATTQGILSFPAGTKMFQFPACPQHGYVFTVLCPIFNRAGFPIRIPPDLRLHTTPRGFSQCTASFFGP